MAHPGGGQAVLVDGRRVRDLDNRLVVVFIAGYARTGSTLLERLLGQIDGFQSFGELRHVWARSFGENQLCGCGRPFHECPFWTEVVRRAYGGFDRIDPLVVERVRTSVDAFANGPRIILGGWPAGYRRRLTRYAAFLEPLYSAIRDVSGARFIVDASKDPQYAYVLRTIPALDVRVVHLIRDSRAVAYSWRRVRERPEIFWERRMMPRYPAVRTALAWAGTNLGAELAGRIGMPYVRVRYEDLATSPEEQLRRIIDRLSLGDRPDLGFIDGGSAQLRPSHTVSGNPMRFATGRVPIRLDDEWRTAMLGRDQTLVRALTRGALQRYGYAGGGDGPAGRHHGGGPGALEMVRTLRLAFAHRREPLAYGRAVSGLALRYLTSRGVRVRGGRWLDVGTGAGALPLVLAEAGARSVAVDIEDRRAGEARIVPLAVADALRLPFPDGSFDGVMSSNVLEHVAEPWRAIDELVRVCRPGGVIYLSWTNWYSPFGGHDWSPFHYLGPRVGLRMATAVRGRPPMHAPGRTLFRVDVGPVVAGLRARPVSVREVTPRYWPGLSWLGRIPGVREVAMWNCVILMRRDLEPLPLPPPGRAGAAVDGSPDGAVSLPSPRP